MKKIIFTFLVLLSTVNFYSCETYNFTNFEEAIFNTPQKVNKIKEPIRENVRLSVLWAGHSTVLLQIYDKVILTDPLLTDMAGGIMKRKKESGLDLDGVTKLDAVLISHAHMDHLSFGSLELLENKFPQANLVFPDGVQYFIPDMNFNMKKIDNNNGFKNCNIGETIEINGIKITSVFALHSGGRYGLDSYVWGMNGYTGYIISYKDVCIFFSGDTGYNKKSFKEIGSRFKIDLALIQLGPCEDCKEEGCDEHVSSAGALDIYNDLNAEYFIPVHFGALKYNNDPDYPAAVLKELIYEFAGGKNNELVPVSNFSAGIKDNEKINSLHEKYKNKILILKEGEQVILK